MTKLKTAARSPSLADIEFFKVFPEDAIANLERAATLRKFRKNTHIIVVGEESHAAYVLVEGSAYAFTDDDDGNEFIVGTFSSGDCFGELGLLDGQARTANVITTSNCQCLVVPRAEINREIMKEPAVAQAIIHLLVGRIRGMTEDVSCLALMDVYGRLVRALNASMTEQADGSRVTERVTHQELASRVGSSREMVSKILKELRVGGYISIENHCVKIHRDLPDRW
ncbi:MAG: Crp/Fnr family transcriptional regulator [Granulosicoccus sp.]|nr:Crp/Fnr family transcriptional regulator [Granulosicoccus sp.]